MIFSELDNVEFRANHPLGPSTGYIRSVIGNIAEVRLSTNSMIELPADLPLETSDKVFFTRHPLNGRLLWILG